MFKEENLSFPPIKTEIYISHIPEEKILKMNKEITSQIKIFIVAFFLRTVLYWESAPLL